MEVLLRADVDDLGKKGDVVEVADGYARNYLVPRGFAIRATRGAVRQAETMRRARETREAREQETAEALAARLGTLTLRVPARVGEGGRLFGSVTAADIAEAVSKQGEMEIDRRKLVLEQPIRELGSYSVAVHLHPEVEATFTIEVVPTTD